MSDADAGRGSIVSSEPQGRGVFVSVACGLPTVVFLSDRGAGGYSSQGAGRVMLCVPLFWDSAVAAKTTGCVCER